MFGAWDTLPNDAKTLLGCGEFQLVEGLGDVVNIGALSDNSTLVELDETNERQRKGLVKLTTRINTVGVRVSTQA